MIALLTASLFLSQVKPASDRDMPLRILPVSAPKFLKGKPVISITDYFVTKTRITRVFRYSYASPYAEVVSKCKKELKGWKVAAERDGKTTSFDKTVNAKTIRYRAVVINDTRLVRDEGAKTKSRPEWKQGTKGWVWVSYDEGYQSGMAPKD